LPAQELGSNNDAPYARLSNSPARRAHLLRGFLNDFEPLPAQFSHALAQSQWLEVAALAHQIKGSASYLNATALCEVADAVEVAARGGQSGVVHRNAQDFVAQVSACLEQVRAALKELQAQETAADDTSSTLERPAVLALVEQVLPLVVSGNFAAHQLLEQLVSGAGSQAWGASAQAALDAFDDLDIEHVLTALDEVAQQC
jgi:HPt (histidine-containing phosphotransfer) domain-containing protein